MEPNETAPDLQAVFPIKIGGVDFAGNRPPRLSAEKVADLLNRTGF